MKTTLYRDGNKNKQSIIFIHGFPFDHRMWKNQVEFLSDYFHCITYNIFEKTDKSGKSEQETLESYVTELQELVTKNKIKKPVLCGLSMGGYIALRAVEKDQSLYKGLILCDTRSEADSNEAKLNRATAIDTINRDGIRRFISEFVPKTLSEFSRKVNPPMLKKLMRIALDRDEVSVKSALLAMQGRTDTTGSLEKIQIPTLIICGQYDTLTTPESMQNLAKQIPNSEFIKIPNAGHMAPFENPEIVNKVIFTFLKKIS